MTKLENLAKAIEKQEGFYFMSRSWRNNNPGNLRNSKFQTGTRNGFAYFSSYTMGWLALWWDLHQKATGNTVTSLRPTSQLKDLINVWAPITDGNDTNAYLAEVCRVTGFTPDTTLGSLLIDL